MNKPRLFKGASYLSPEQGLAAFSIPNNDVGAKLIVVKVSEQSLPFIVLLRRAIDEEAAPRWYERLLPFLFAHNADTTDHFTEILGDQHIIKEVKGRVVKSSAPEYDPDQKKTGGRVVRAMPRQLKKIKEGQEASGDN